MVGESECVWGQNGKKYDCEKKKEETKVQSSADCEVEVEIRE